MSRVDDAVYGVWGSRNRLRARVGTAIGLVFLAGPISDVARASLATWQLVAICVCMTAFVGLYLSLLPPLDWFVCATHRARGGVIGLAVLATATLVLGENNTREAKRPWHLARGLA